MVVSVTALVIVTVMFLVAGCVFLIVVALDVDAFVVENVILTTILIVIGFVVFVPVDVVLTIPYCHDDYFSL